MLIHINMTVFVSKPEFSGQKKAHLFTHCSFTLNAKVRSNFTLHPCDRTIYKSFLHFLCPPSNLYVEYLHRFRKLFINGLYTTTKWLLTNTNPTCKLFFIRCSSSMHSYCHFFYKISRSELLHVLSFFASRLVFT